MALKLKQEVIEKVLDDPGLYTLVCKEMDIKPGSLTVIAKRNGNPINKYSVVTAIANYLHVEPETLVEDKK